MAFSFAQIAQLFRSKRVTNEELLVQQMPTADVDLPKALGSVVRFAETKQILDQIVHAQSERKVRSITVLSELPREGRSLFTAALAMSFAQLVRQKVLVVDCHTLRGPYSLSLERLLETDELGEEDRHEKIRNTISPNVSIVRLRDWAEQRDAVPEYEVKSLIDGPGKGFDLIVFDTCAMAAKNRNNLDPVAIARRCDTAVLVVSARSSSRSTMHEIRERIKKEKLDLLGIVRNEGILA